MNTNESADAYFRCIRARDVDGLVAPYPTRGPRVVGAHEIAAEIDAKMPDGSIRNTANFFYVNDAGRIQRLHVYSRGN
jgi:hypothetical protein